MQEEDRTLRGQRSHEARILEDEHPLRAKHLRRIARYFSHVHIRHSNLVALAAVPLSSTPMFRTVPAGPRRFDTTLCTALPFTRRIALMAFIECANPTPESAIPPIRGTWR